MIFKELFSVLKSRYHNIRPQSTNCQSCWMNGDVYLLIFYVQTRNYIDIDFQDLPFWKCLMFYNFCCKNFIFIVVGILLNFFQILQIKKWFSIVCNILVNEPIESKGLLEGTLLKGTNLTALTVSRVYKQDFNIHVIYNYF